ncbi:MAG: hypothetical protein [Bacteriophage sp.]|nr:MAG: hypothetical protein [Bacteriophage sp.]
MPRKDKVIHISNLPSTFRGNITRNGRFIQTTRSNGRNLPQKQYAVGGKIPNVVDGGIAHPLGNNFFYMNGRKHSQGGIDIGPSDKTGIEVEDGEIVETNGDELKVYSAQPIINGVSPAKLVMGGANPNKVFKAQEDFKDRNKINDDGTIKAMGGLSRDKDYGSKKKPYPSVAKKDFAGGHRSYPIPTKADAIDALRLAGLHGRNDVKAKVYNKYPELRKKGSNGLIISINGNVKNGLLHSPSSTGGRHDKLRDGGKRINRHGRTWGYDEDNGYYIPITDRTITRTSPYPIDRSARGETVSGSEYTFRNGRWYKNKSNTFNDNPTKNSKVDNGNRRPQYYAERELPLFNDGPAITSGLVKAGWSHGNNKNITVDNTNIPNLPTTKSKGNTPRRGRNKSSQSVQSSSTKTPPTATYNRNLPTIKASIPTTLPVSTSVSVKQSSQSDGKGQGKFKNITTADWIGLGSNIAGGLGSYFASKRAINKMRGPGRPTLISANKLKTKYNINPQLDRIREDKFEAYRDIDSNTASSRVGLARKQRVRNAAGQAVNQLYGEKENIETNLINQDRRNQQSVRQFNAQQYNQYIDRKTAFDNGIREAKLTNVNNLFTGINAGIQDMISRYENRKALNNTISAMRASAPNVDDRIMRDAGVDYDEFIIRKRRKLGGKQSCR